MVKIVDIVLWIFWHNSTKMRALVRILQGSRGGGGGSPGARALGIAVEPALFQADPQAQYCIWSSPRPHEVEDIIPTS